MLRRQEAAIPYRLVLGGVNNGGEEVHLVPGTDLVLVDNEVEHMLLSLVMPRYVFWRHQIPSVLPQARSSCRQRAAPSGSESSQRRSHHGPESYV